MKELRNKFHEDMISGTTANRAFLSGRVEQKKRGISNSGGQLSFQTDNKQATINRGTTNPDVQGKKHSPRVHH
ncbi:hypothetical protein [Solitalea lacus]|uniref:hypothetical protein n=1 Tax=Solitalea lacus TaxID=2911172 RepID=UPI001EDACCE2|nr:hypothetical protein [Solitalea lacus]UKJ08334.1 hypothetical protein L2B55_03980 [Solitalea lacus]